MMKILYVVSRPLEINTSASLRNRALIDGLLELGHEVEVITSQLDKNHSNYDETLLNKSLNTRYLELGGVQRAARIGRKLKYIRPIRKLAFKIMSNLEVYDNLKGFASFYSDLNINDRTYDIIISSSDPKSSHLFVSKLYENGLVKKTPWIQIWGDPFLSDITRKNKLLNHKIKQEEIRLLKHANKVIYVSNLTLKEQQKIYPNYAEKMFYEPIPYLKQEVYPIRDNKNKSLSFLYCGDYATNVRDIRPLYNAIRNSNHKLVICGNGDANLESTDRIKIYPRVSYEKTKEFEKNCDVLIHLSNLNGTQIPGKIYQQSGTNRFILFILDGKSNDLIDTFSSYERYIFCENNIDGISKAISDINNGEYDHTRFVCEDFSPLKIANNIIK